MPALTVNGITIPIRADTFKEERVTIGDSFQRSVGGAMFSSMISKRRRFSFRTPPIESSLAEKYAKLIEGTALVWTFNNGNFLSGSGVGPSSAVGGSLATSPVKYGGISLNLTAGSGFLFNARNKFALSGGWTTYGFDKPGWTIAFWAYLYVGADNIPVEGWYHCIATGTGVVTRGATPMPAGVRQYRDGVQSQWGFGNILKIDSASECGIYGYTTPAPPTAGITTLRYLDDIVFLPYSLPAEWVSSFYQYASSFDPVTNLCIPSEDFTAWIATLVIVTANADVAPDGSGASLLSAVGVSNAIQVYIPFTFSGTKVVSIYLKKGSASSTDLSIYDSTAAAHRHWIRVTWGVDGSPTLSTISGSGTRFTPVDSGNGWWRISFTATPITSTNTNVLVIYPANASTSSGTVYAWGAQAQDSTVVGKYVATTTAAATSSTFDGFCLAPLVELSGDHIDNNRIKCFGRVEQVDHINAKTTANYTTKPNVKVLDVVLEER